MNIFLEHLKDFSIFLASRSPRRIQLLEDLGIPFKQWIIEDIEEDYPTSLNIEMVAQYLSEKKSKPYKAMLEPGFIIITADTVVCSSNKILGKPSTHDEAKQMLQELSGQEHSVVTGVSILSMEKERHFSAVTEVRFAGLSEEEMDYYIDEFKPFDKAGSYGIQEWIGLIGVESINGSYFNVMGLPIQRLYRELKSFTNYTKKA
jgi:septum formation protein